MNHTDEGWKVLNCENKNCANIVLQSYCVTRGGEGQI